MRTSGFTLIELVIVIVITGILAGMVGLFLKPAIDGYFDTWRRAGLTDLADTALRRMGRDIRMAVPNSIRTPNSQCFELIPTSTGGRYRMAPDTVWDSAHPGSPSAPMDGTQPVKSLDVLSPMSAMPSTGDWLVIDNQNANDVYAAAIKQTVGGKDYWIGNRARIGTVGSPPDASLGTSRISLDGTAYPDGFQFPSAYQGGRFVAVADSQQAVFYFCSGVGIDANGNGTGTLYRLSHYGFNAAYPTACPSSPATVLASHVQACNFVYSPSQGATQQNGFVWMQLVLTQANESVSLVFGEHVDNVP
ncbi:MAG: type II secretion system protein [Methylococcaceae bacterium]|nr:type II secretion system protein [Methylococcaceae bacterium]